VLCCDIGSLARAIFDLELISHHYSSCCCSCWGDRFKKAKSSIVSNPIGMKFGSIVPQLNPHRLTDGHNFKMAAMTSFHAEYCCHLVN